MITDLDELPRRVRPYETLPAVAIGLCSYVRKVAEVCGCAAIRLDGSTGWFDLWRMVPRDPFRGLSVLESEGPCARLKGGTIVQYEGGRREARFRTYADACVFAGRVGGVMLPPPGQHPLVLAGKYVFFRR